MQIWQFENCIPRQCGGFDSLFRPTVLSQARVNRFTSLVTEQIIRLSQGTTVPHI